MNKTKPAQSIFILQTIEEQNLKTAKKCITSSYRTIPQMKIKAIPISQRNSYSPHFPCAFFSSAKLFLFPFYVFCSPRDSVLFDKHLLISDLVYLQ